MRIFDGAQGAKLQNLPGRAPQTMQTDTNTGTHRHVGYYWVKTPTGWLVMDWSNHHQSFLLDGHRYPGKFPDAQIIEVNENRLPSPAEVDTIMKADNWVAMDVPIDILENTPPVKLELITPLGNGDYKIATITKYRSIEHKEAYTSKHRKN